MNWLKDQHSQVAKEILALKAAWTALSGIWAQLAGLCEMPWSSVAPQQLPQLGIG
ncbi:uncharacterized protein MELLADRAFT_86664 [Melampsora larici-populina 98AG31]|uniref:Uncharacterized protein n=1 Tax=Melampsora larici-populina (strain 98AG31 / pathotype 3-4-7) TaxID=747676 RepID=F4RMK8_MELLP|nr:uncharacterized protein MELLADRAFT_86664 [Melampsora larici-populina 98AG31]EGG06449.1 hypothetical protein MELLADRAFT_86664 [Melampsora larici-populina 98AG31]